MGDILNDFFEELIETILNWVVGGLDWFSQYIIGPTFLQGKNGGLMDVIDTYFPFMYNSRVVLTYISVSIVVLLLLMNIIRTIMSPPDSPDLEHPLLFTGRAFFAIVMAFFIFALCKMALEIGATWQLKLADNKNFGEYLSPFQIQDGDGQAEQWNWSMLSEDMETNINSGLAVGASTFFTVSGIGPILTLILLLIIAYQYIKLCIEIYERYIVVALMSYLSPLAASALGSKTTHKIFTGYCKMYFSQILLMALNIWILRVFYSACLAYLTHGGIVKNVPTATYLTFYVCLATLMVAGQKLDSYMHSMGMTVAQTGGGVMATGAIVMGQIGRQMGNINRISKGGGIIGAGRAVGNYAFKNQQLGQAIARNGLMTANAAEARSGNPIRKVLGQNMAVVSGAGKTGVGQEWFVQGPNGRSRAATYQADKLPRDSRGSVIAGMWTKDAEGNMRYTTATGPDAGRILSPVHTSAIGDHNTDMNSARELSLLHQNEYAKSFAAGSSQEEAMQHANRATENYAINHGFGPEYALHQEELKNAFGQDMDYLPAGVPKNGLTIEPVGYDPSDPSKPFETGLYRYYGTNDDGEFVQGTMSVPALRPDGYVPETAESFKDASGNDWRVSQDPLMPNYDALHYSDANDMQSIYQNTEAPVDQIWNAHIDDKNPMQYESALKAEEWSHVDGGQQIANDLSEVYESSYQQAVSENREDPAAWAKDSVTAYVEEMTAPSYIDYFENAHFPGIYDEGFGVTGKIREMDTSKLDSGIIRFQSVDSNNIMHAYEMHQVNGWAPQRGSTYKLIKDGNGAAWYLTQAEPQTRTKILAGGKDTTKTTEFIYPEFSKGRW